jgi:abequosyltransferase
MIRLSICIATFNRGNFIGETLDSILAQMESSVELVIVDGASPDNTPEIMAKYLLHYPEIRYYREQKNSGVDRDYDKAIGYAAGEYCWLMTDDDLLRPGAIRRVLGAIDEEVDLVIVNSEVRSVDLRHLLAVRLPDTCEDTTYEAGAEDIFFTRAARYLSFIGAVVIRRNVWMARDRAAYYGTLFVHVGVVFQHPPIARIKVIAEPLVMIRLGNAMWTPRGFEIWMFKWPQLIWSFSDFSDKSKATICPREPWRQLMRIFYYRAIGGYNTTSYRQFIQGRTNKLIQMIFLIIAIVPEKLANFLSVVYCVFLGKSAHMALYDLSHSQYGTWAGRVIFKKLVKARK